MAEQATPLTWLEIVVSWPGAIIAFCVAAIVIFCLLTFSNPLRIVVSRLKIKLGGGGRRLEISSADQPAQEPVEEGSTALVKPAATEKADKQLDLEETAPAEGELPLEGDDEITLQKKMLVAGFRDRDPDKIEAVYQKWNALEDRETSNEVFETLRSRMRLAAGIQAAENELKELEQENATWIDPSLVLTDYFEDLARFDLAEPHAQKAIDRSNTDLRKAHSYRVMADIRIQLGTQADALELLNNAISEVLENEAKARILDKVAEIHEAANDKLMAAKALEHALKLTPSDKGRRFKLAYIYFDHGRQHLALFHYRILADQDPRHPSTMNNLAIVYGGLKLPGKCVEAWKRAASWGETHPMGNLSIQFIKHGFYDEARKVLDDVPLEHRDNPRVIKAISFLESTNEQEDEELNKHLEAMKVHHKYMLLAVEAEQNPELNQLTPKDLAGDWATASGAELKIDLSEGGDLNAVLTVPTRFSPLAGLIAGTSRSSPSERKFSLNLFKNGLVLTGTGFPLTQERGSTLIGGGSPPNRDYFLVVTGKTNIRGFYSTDYKNPLEISFNRS